LYLFQIFRASPLMAVALCLCLVTIFWCIRLSRRQSNGLDKILTGLLGLIAIYEALRVLKDSGFILFPGVRRLEGWVDFLIASLYLIAAVILRISSIDRATTKVRLRLVEANEKAMDAAWNITNATPEAAHAVFDASPLATFAVDVNGIVIYWNTAAESLIGWTRDEVMGQRLPFSGPGPIADKSGHEIEAAIWTAPIRFSNGSLRGTLTIVADRSKLQNAGLDLHLPATPQLALNS
jgi:PAS domain-containing protein